jgi:hypothetical protein
MIGSNLASQNPHLSKIMSMDKFENTAHVNSIEVIKSKIISIIIITHNFSEKEKDPSYYER